MIVALSNLKSSPNRVRHHDPELFGSEVVSYTTTLTNRSAGEPQVVLVEVPAPGQVLRPHYHASDQYQLVLAGSGTLGTHHIAPISLHYTNKYTGYGPIVSGTGGLSYYVLRPSFDTLSVGQYLHHPKVREAAKRYRGKRRSFMHNGLDVLTRGALLAAGEPATIRLFGNDPSDPDGGIFADVLCMGPSRLFTCPDPASGGGQVLFVLQGSLRYKDRDLTAPSCIVVTLDEASLIVQAGPGGLQALLMQYPRPRQ